MTGASGTSWVAIDRRECLDLLKTAACGRLAVTVNALPTILPVAIEMREDDLSLRVLPGSLVPVRSHQVVALETGNLDDVAGGQWSVVVRGMLVREVPEYEPFTFCGVVAGRFRLSTELLSGWRPARPLGSAQAQNRAGREVALT